jgi:hypothetical protein
MKNLMTLLLLLSGLSAAIAAFAGEEKKPVPRSHAQTPEWTNPRTGDPGIDSVATDLQGIVVLCAKDHNSAEFKRAWAAYVRENKLQGSALENTKRKVVNEAYRHRQEFGQSKGDRKEMIEWKKGAEKSMHDTAMSVIRKIG